MSLRLPARPRGFTLVELVLTLIVLGVVAAVFAPRLISSRGFASRGFYDEAQAVVRFAQKTAIAWRRSIYVCVTTTEIRATSDSNCAAPPPVTVTHPLTGGELKSTAPSGVTLSLLPAGNFSFDAMGRLPSASKTITITGFTDDPARQIVVEAETGYVHR